MTRAWETTNERYVEMDDKDASGQPWCPFCGGLMVDEGDRVVCASCRTDALAEPKPVAER